MHSIFMYDYHYQLLSIETETTEKYHKYPLSRGKSDFIYLGRIAVMQGRWFSGDRQTHSMFRIIASFPHMLCAIYIGHNN